MPALRSVLIANRGEIAVRIAKTLRQEGVEAVALQSPLDRGAFHTIHADRVLDLEGPDVRSTYLDARQIVALAKSNGVDAIHPGYGFLSENAGFARVCEEAGLVFIGPDSATIAAMGSKANAKALMQKAGVPTVPGYHGDDQNPATLKKHAKAAGYPVLIKASGGGGGKGMRVARSEKEFDKAAESARSEALKAFGDGRLIVEKYVENPRHVEVQIFGDAAGNVIHLGERECSIQRRHQKIIEESPSPALDPALRAKMTAAAVACGRAISYRNAGTVEFILAPDGAFYFLEMNTRLQVEHPVTEWRVGADLVAWQLRVAQGLPLPAQDAIAPRGHALECRLYAEDPANGFLPATGTVLLHREPSAPFTRVDSGVAAGAKIGVDFDPMIAKISVWDETRDGAVRRMVAALKDYPVLGVRTNAAFLLDVLAHPDFAAGRFDTHFLERAFASWSDAPPPGHTALLAQLFAARSRLGPAAAAAPAAAAGPAETWDTLKNFRLGDV